MLDCCELGTTPAGTPTSPPASLGGRLASGEEVLGLHPVRSGQQTAAAQMPLALWMQWQTGQPDSDNGSQIGQQSASLRIGCIFAANVPGFLDEVLRFISLHPSADGTADSSGNRLAAEVDSEAATPSTNASSEAQTPELLTCWLTQSLTLDVAVSAAQLVQPAARDVAAEALLLDIGNVSGQLGGIEASAISMAHSMAATLLRHPKGGPPAYALRLAISRIQLSTAAHWPPGTTVSSDVGDAAATTPVSTPMELHVLLLACSADGTAIGSAVAAAPTDGWACWAAVSDAAFCLTSKQVAALLAAVNGFSADSDSALQSPEDAGDSAALGQIAVQLSTVHVAYSQLGAPTVCGHGGVLRTGSSGPPMCLELAVDVLKFNVSGAASGGGPAAAVYGSCHQVSAALSPGSSLHIPLVDFGFCTGPSGSDWLSVPSCFPCRLAGMTLLQQEANSSIHRAASDDSSQQAAAHCSIQLHSVTAALAVDEWSAVLMLADQLTASQLLPPHTSYTQPVPPPTRDNTSSSVLSADLGSMTLSLAVPAADSRVSVLPEHIGLSLFGLLYGSCKVSVSWAFLAYRPGCTLIDCGLQLTSYRQWDHRHLHLPASALSTAACIGQ